MKNTTKKSWNYPEGYWQVTTEADCEGRSMKTLGFFKGNYAEIALALADKCCYSLHFARIPVEDMELPVTKEDGRTVCVTFSDGYLIDRALIAKDVQKVLGEKFIVTNKGSGDVQLCKANAEEVVRRKALDKIKGVLSYEEMRVLGINL